MYEYIIINRIFSTHIVTIKKSFDFYIIYSLIVNSFKKSL